MWNRANFDNNEDDQIGLQDTVKEIAEAQIDVALSGTPVQNYFSVLKNKKKMTELANTQAAMFTNTIQTQVQDQIIKAESQYEHFIKQKREALPYKSYSLQKREK